MTPIMKRTEKDDAVSPVVGVMLMLVVTIIIAAVVAVFASGVANQTEAVPNVVLDVKVTNESSYTPENHGLIYITNINGDDIDTTKLTIKVVNATGSSASWTNPNAGEYMGVDFGVLRSGQTMKMINGWFDTSGNAAISEKVGIDTGDKVNVAVVYGDYVLFSKDIKVTA